MRIEYADAGKFTFSGDVPNLDRRIIQDAPIFEGATCRIVLGLQYHFTLGGWDLTNPPTWDPSREVGVVWLSEMPGDQKSEVIESKKIFLANFGQQPPINAEINALTFLNVRRLGVKKSVIGISCFTTSFALPDLNGRGPLILYIAANAKIYVDENLVVDKNYISASGDSTQRDAFEIIRRDSE
jgi:hypothetical protein